MTHEELKERQGWGLQQKIDHSLEVIETFVARAGGIDKVYVSFSSGKDSCVLLDLCRIIYPDIKAVFFNTGNEYPDIISHVKSLIRDGYNIDIVRPKYTPRQVWEKFGFPLISKEQSMALRQLKTTKSEKLRNYRLYGREGQKRSAGVLSKKWRPLINEPFMVSEMCCQKLKKDPAHKYTKDTGRFPIVGVMASESKLRESNYIRNGGCNVFDSKKGLMSMPLSIWLEEDIWEYIKLRNLKIAEIYHKGADRTGCVGCSYGAFFADDHRFELLYKLYPKYYNMIMNYTNNGVTYREALRKALAINGMNLPDEKPKDLFTEIE